MRILSMTLLLLASLLFLGNAANAQAICPYISTGAVLTAAQWNACFSAKNDTLGYTPLNLAGGFMTGALITTPSIAGAAGFNLSPGTAPTTPNNGDLWTTSAGIFVQINGVTIGPLAQSTAGSFAAIAPLVVTFPAGVTTYGLTNANANTLFGNVTTGSAARTDFTIDGLTLKASPAAGDEVICWDVAGAALKKCNVSGIGSASGVSSVAGNTGAFTLDGDVTNDVNKIVMQQMPPGGRITLTSATPITTTDVTGATSIYYAPMNSPWVPIYNGTQMRLYNFTASATDAVGLTVALGANWATNSNYDWFVGLNSTTVTFCSGPAWTSDTARGTGAGTTELQMYNGIWTNKNSMTCRYGNATTFTCAVNQCTYLGTNRTVAAGQAEDSMAKRFVWNAYNQVQRVLKNVTETTVSWTYTLTAPRQANANAANQLDMVVGLAGSLLDAKVAASGDTSAGGSFVGVGIGINSTTVNSSQEQQTTACLNRCAISAVLQTYPAIGRQFYPWLEFAGVASGTNTYEGGSTTYLQSGISGTVLQ